jgi:3-oxoacyl-[acyl-carrier-protein] synthase III
MKIHAISHAVPELVLTNDQAIALFRDRNAGRFTAAQLDALERKICDGLKLAGTQKRHITPPGQSVRHLVLDAALDALTRANVAATDIDLIIYVGIGRGWLEPAMASWVQRELGVRDATGFDVVDACASWMRGLQVAQAMLQQDRYETVLLVNSEAGMSSFADVELQTEEALWQYFATFTLGEAATAAVLSRDASKPVYFNFRSFTDGFNLCLIPLANAVCYAPDIRELGIEPGRFYAQSDRLVSTTIRRIVETYRADPKINHGRYDVVFSHSASARAIEIIAAQTGLPIENYVPTHAEFGNTSSASIPLGMSLALRDDRLKRGDNVLAIAGSAGITVGFASFTF